MRLLVLSDVHADARALDRVLSHAAQQGWDEMVFLGDAVGYGDEPREAVGRLRALPVRAGVLGNHEAMLGELRAGRRPAVSAHVVAALAGQLNELKEPELEFLDRLQPLYLGESLGAVHGALRAPFEYMISVPVARSNAARMKRPVYFVGHTHVPAAYLQEQGGPWRVRPFTSGEGRLCLPKGARAFLNPGSVSLPRDGIPGSSYGIYDEASHEFTVFRLA
jgi:predicted phosphodiesterase